MSTFAVCRYAHKIFCDVFIVSNISIIIHEYLYLQYLYYLVFSGTFSDKTFGIKWYVQIAKEII